MPTEPLTHALASRRGSGIARLLARAFPPRKPQQPASAPSDLAARVFIAAFERIARRGAGQEGWSTPLHDDPSAFLLDSMSDAAHLWDSDGALIYRNRASASRGLLGLTPSVRSCMEGPVERIDFVGRHFERRFLRMRSDGRDFVLEIIRELSADECS